MVTTPQPKQPRCLSCLFAWVPVPRLDSHRFDHPATKHGSSWWVFTWETNADLSSRNMVISPARTTISPISKIMIPLFQDCWSSLDQQKSQQAKRHIIGKSKMSSRKKIGDRRGILLPLTSMYLLLYSMGSPSINQTTSWGRTSMIKT